MITCPNCNHQNPPEASFCMECGTKLTIKKPNEPESKAVRRQVTFLFCDLVDSTVLSNKLDPEEYRTLIYDYHQVVENTVKNYGGTVGNYLGDGLLVYFGYPKGLEDAPKAAIQASLDTISALSNINKEWTKDKKPEIKVRIGIHTGKAVLDEHLALGSSVNIASRIEGQAPVNGVLISPQTKKLVEGWFEIKSTGKHHLKGLEEPIELFQVLSESGARSRFEVSKKKGLSPLVGREAEIDSLRKIWSEIKGGNGQIVLISGEAGIGKSRLVDALKTLVEKEQESMVLLASSSAYHSSSSFYPIQEMIENEILKFDLDEDPERKFNKLRAFLESQPNTGKESLALLAEFLSIRSDQYQPLAISPVAKRQMLFESISQLLTSLPAKKPLLFIIEDLHWSDASTLEWIEIFLDIISEHPILLVFTTRTIFTPAWSDRDNVKTFSLERISKDEIHQICLHQSAGKKLPDEIINQIDQKTEGVPLFVEELTKMILESDFLIEKDLNFETADNLTDLPIPSTLQDSLIARLDQLEDVKELVQISSVLGKEFSRKMLDTVYPMDQSTFSSSMNKLLDAEIFLDKMIGQDQYYLFKHSLIQDAAYDSILKSERKKMHNEVASVIEQEFLEIAENQPEILANHYTMGNSIKKAVPLWLKAGQTANQKNANFEAINHLQKGLELLPHLDSVEEQRNFELDFYLTLGGCYVMTHGFPHPKVKETFDKARSLTQDIEVSPKLALILMNLLSYYSNTEDYTSAEETIKYFESLANHPKFGYWFDLVYRVPAMRLIHGDLLGSEKDYIHAIKIYNPNIPFPWELSPSGNPEVAAKSWSMSNLFILGKYKQGNELASNHLNYLKDHKDSVTMYHIYTFSALDKIDKGHYKEAIEILERYFPVVRAYGDPVFNLTAEVYYHLAKGYLGDKQSIEISRNLLDTCFQIGFRAFASVLSSHLGILYYNQKDYKSTLEWSDQIINHFTSSGSIIKLAEAYRTKALALDALGREDDEVVKYFKKALEVSRTISAKTFELRAAKDYAQFLSAQGKNQEGYTLLKEVYDWFEGEDRTKDLESAKKLLEELSNR